MNKLQETLDFLKSNCNYTLNDESAMDIEGYSGRKILNAIIRLTEIYCLEPNNKNNIYLEIGVFKGFTLLNNSINNKNIDCVGIDNFHFFDKDKKNMESILDKAEKLMIKNFSLINSDFEDALSKIEKLNKKIGVFFVDGAHDYRSQLIALEKYKHLLANESVIIIDDSNYYHVRRANQDFLNNNKDFKLIFEAYTPRHIANYPNEEKQEPVEGYWNGINIIVKDNNDNLVNNKIQMPNEVILKEIFPISHEIFRNGYAYATKEILDLISSYKTKQITEKELVAKIESLSRPGDKTKIEKYNNQNTYSEELVTKVGKLKNKN